MQTVCVKVIFKTLELIRLSRIFSYTNHESGKFKAFTCKLCRGAFYPGKERFHSRDQHRFKFMETKEKSSIPTGLVWNTNIATVTSFKRFITWKGPSQSRHFYREIRSNAHEQCFTRCPVSRLVHSQGRSASVITGKISNRYPSITILGSQLTGLTDWLGCHIEISAKRASPAHVIRPLVL